MSEKFVAFLQRLSEVFNSINTTNARIFATIVLSCVTAVRYLFLSNVMGEMSEAMFNSWLIFIAALGGWDVTQYMVKRKTFNPDAQSNSAVETKGIYTRRESSEHKGVEPSL